MKQLTEPKSRPYKTIREVQIERQRVSAQIKGLKEELKRDRSQLIHNSFFGPMRSGMSFTSNISKWIIYYRVFKKTMGWFKRKKTKP